MKANWGQLVELARREIEATLKKLPKPLYAEARKLPITFEAKPSAELQADGVEADTLGLFTGRNLLK